MAKLVTLHLRNMVHCTEATVRVFPRAVEKDHVRIDPHTVRRLRDELCTGEQGCTCGIVAMPGAKLTVQHATGQGLLYGLRMEDTQ